MLNIGKLLVGAAEYYIGEVATAAEDYYTGHGEAKGRWVGSMAAELGLKGEVNPDHFRRVLNGQHPRTETYLVSSQGSASRARTRRNDVHSTKGGTAGSGGLAARRRPPGSVRPVRAPPAPGW